MDVFGRLSALKGTVYREQEGRKTLRFTHDDKNYFVKLHGGVGWKEIIKNVIQFRIPVLGAQNEWRAIQRLGQLGIRTPALVGYGKKGWNPASLNSFVVMEELAHTVSLEDFCRDWRTIPPDNALKRALIIRVAKIARVMHEHGINHRDFYICHFLLDVSLGPEGLDPDNLELYLIDLHRAQIRRHTPWRWRVKDIAALYFSSMDIGLTQRDLLLFIKIYKDKPLRVALRQDRIFWFHVKRRGINLYKKIFHSRPNSPSES